jgi:hypothetical protein
MKFYSYDIQLEKPQPSQSLHFENDTFSISFAFKPQYIEFELYNKLDDGIKINFDEISISVNQQAIKIVHYAPGTNEFYETQPPTTIPPRSKLKDALVAKDMVNYIYEHGRQIPVSIQDSYPKSDYSNNNISRRVQHLKGQKITIFLPYYLKNVYHSKTFEFIIADVKTRT